MTRNTPTSLLMKSTRKILEGTQLTLLQISRTKSGGRTRIILTVRCSCGTVKDFPKDWIVAGRVISCGCKRRGKAKTHGATINRERTKEYRTWISIKIRTQYDSQHPQYLDVEVDPRWLTSYEVFLEDMGRAPSEAHTIDRKDNTKGYNKDNCRWATRIEQANNKRNNRQLTVNKETKTVAEWARATGLSYTTIIWRLNNGRSPEEALGLKT